MAVQWYRAQQAFSATLSDGITERPVTLGEVLPASHELVKRDLDGARVLFAPLEEPEEAPAKPSRRSAKGGM